MSDDRENIRKNVSLKDAQAGIIGADATVHGGINFIQIDHVTVYRSRSEEESAGAGENRTADIGPNPYVGLGAFQEQDADRFFGREKLTEKLWKKLRDLHQPGIGEEKIRLLPILGPSGTGKSSVARAGLIRELGRNPLPGFKKARVAVLTPGNHPLYALAGILARIETGETLPVKKTREILDELKVQTTEGEFDGLTRTAHLFPDIHATPLILLVDQFEEVYTLCKDEAERTCFIQNLLHAASDASGYVSVVLTLRSDFLAETQSSEVLNRAIADHGEIIPAMNREELHEAIARPAEEAGHPLDEAVVDMLIEQARDREGALPLLQFALTRIWEGMAQGKKPSDTLEKMGGVGGALAGEANRLFKKLSDHDQVIVRRAFLGMVTLGEGVKDTRRRVRLDHVVGGDENLVHVKKVLKLFSDRNARLVTLSGGKGKEGVLTAEITHEALLEHWTVLKEWLDEDRDARRLHRRLETAAEHWKEQNRPAGLLWRSPDLDRVRKLYQEKKEDFSALREAFYQESEKAYLASKRAVKKRQRLYLLVSILIITGISIAFFIVREQKEIAIEKEKEAVYNLTLMYDKMAHISLSAALNGDNPNETFQKAWLYTLEVLKKEIPDIKKLPITQERLASKELHLGLVRSAEPDSAVRFKGFATEDKNLNNIESDLLNAYSKAGNNAPEFKAVYRISYELFPYKMDGSSLVPVQEDTLQSRPWYADYPRPPRKDPVQWMIETAAQAVHDKKMTMKGVSRDWIAPYLNSGSTEPTTAPGKHEPITNGFGMTFVYIEPGSFFMGSPREEPGRSDDEVFHMVTLTEGFHMQTTEVTQGQWMAVMEGENPSHFNTCGSDCPVENVSWDMVQGFIQALNQKTGETYRLPTEAEWEYAARAGTTTPFCYGRCLSTEQANYAGTYPLTGCSPGIYRQQTIPAGSLNAPNAWGLHDMHGNVWEWCQDFYANYPRNNVSNPLVVVDVDTVLRVLRGGSWNVNARNCRSAFRNRNTPSDRFSNAGFRLVREAP